MKLNKESLIMHSSRAMFVRYAIPGMIGTLMATIAGMVDGLFVARFVNADAFAAIGVISPITSLTFGVFVMLTVGATAVAGKFIGENKRIRANLVFTQTVIVTAIFGIVSIIILYNLRHIIQPILGAHGNVLKYTNEYILPLLVASFFMGTAYTLTQFVKLDGSPRFASSAFVVAASMNILLDALFIVVFKWGIAGAGWATAISQLTALLMMCCHFFRPKSHLRIIKVYGGWGYVVKAAFNGFSEFINSASGGLIPWLINITAFRIAGNAGILAYSVANYAFFGFTMLLYALSESIQPLISVSYGAKNLHKIKSFLGIALALGVFVAGVLTSILFLKPSLLANIFLVNVDKETYDVSIFFLRAISISFIPASISIIMSSYYTSVQCAGASATVAFLRSVLLPVTFILTLPYMLDALGLVMVIPLAEVITFIVALLLYKKRKASTLLGMNLVATK